jgi:beta-aspartyl-peptidase (threonine type)
MPKLSNSMLEAPSWTIVVHGGARTIASADAEANRRGCAAAAAAGAEVLRGGGSAVDAAEAAIRVLEDDPIFNAGFGSARNADGEIEMDAAIMDGQTLALGAVAGVRRLRNPIVAACAMLEELPVLLAGEGAERFAVGRGIPLCDPRSLHAPERIGHAGHDTVGCVARDLSGHFAAATSTGGLSGKLAGRIGDSPIPGCGLYADDLAGAVSLSGDGESISRVILAARILQELESGSSAMVAARRIDQLQRVGGEAGAIVLDRAGVPGIAHGSDQFAVGLATNNMRPLGAVHVDELWEHLA